MKNILLFILGGALIISGVAIVIGHNCHQDKPDSLNDAYDSLESRANVEISNIDGKTGIVVGDCKAHCILKDGTPCIVNFTLHFASLPEVARFGFITREPCYTLSIIVHNILLNKTKDELARDRVKIEEEMLVKGNEHKGSIGRYSDVTITNFVLPTEKAPVDASLPLTALDSTVKAPVVIVIPNAFIYFSAAALLLSIIGLLSLSLYCATHKKGDSK